MGRLESQIRGQSIMLFDAGSDEAKILVTSPLIEGIDTLWLDGNGLGPEGAEALAASPYAADLTTLRLESEQIGDHGVTAIAESEYLRGLEALVLENNEIGDDGALALAESNLVDNLQTLVLAKNAIRDQGAIALAESPALHRLQRLNLSDNEISDDGVVALVDSENLPSLQRLLIADNPVGRDGLDALHGSERVEAAEVSTLRRQLDRKVVESILNRTEGEDAVEPWDRILADEEMAGVEEQVSMERSIQSDETGCPGDVQFQVVITHFGLPMLIERFVSAPPPDEPLRLDEDRARQLGFDDSPEPIWVFSDESGDPCQMQPTIPLLIPGPPADESRARLATGLRGHCSFSDAYGRSQGIHPIFFAIRAPEVAEDCLVEKANLTDTEMLAEGLTLPDEMVELRRDLDEDDEMNCSDDDDNCTLHWRFRRLDLPGDRQVVTAEVVETQPWPENTDAPCPHDVRDSWSSGLVMKSGDEYHRLSDESWPTILYFGNEEPGSGLLGLTNLSTEILTWSLSEKGLPLRQRTHRWSSKHADEVVPQSSYRDEQFACQP